MEIRSLLIKDTTKEERENIIKQSLDCGGGCENCTRQRICPYTDGRGRTKTTTPLSQIFRQGISELQRIAHIMPYFML